MGSATYDCPQCGKSIKVSRGNNRDSQRYADFLAKRGDRCRACEETAFKAQHEAKIAAAASSPVNATLPPLIGTEKQVAWAQALRLEALPQIDAAVQTLIDWIGTEDRLSDEARNEMFDAVHLLGAERRERSSASAWIDSRDDHVETCLREELQRRQATLAPTAVAEVRAFNEQPQAAS